MELKYFQQIQVGYIDIISNEDNLYIEIYYSYFSIELENNLMEKEEALKYWIESSDRDFQTAKSLMELAHYSWALFICHLVVEKLLKAHYVKIVDTSVPLTHDLNRIASKSNLELSSEQKDLLDIVAKFNIKARYEDYKQEFYKTCTKEFSEKYFKEISEFREWIRNKL